MPDSACLIWSAHLHDALYLHTNSITSAEDIHCFQGSMGKGGRPEHTNPPEIFYNEDEARKYTSNSRMMEIQVRLN